MLAAAGILFEDLLGHIGAGGPAAKTPWFEAGKFEYFAPASTLTIIEFFLFAWVEIRRYQDMKKPGRSVNTLQCFVMLAYIGLRHCIYLKDPVCCVRSQVSACACLSRYG